jgi:hypothetical protein
MDNHDIVPPDWSSVLRIGQDARGRWLVQDTAGRLEGFFRSRDTALSFARTECDILRTTIEFADAPLVGRALH